MGENKDEGNMEKLFIQINWSAFSGTECIYKTGMNDKLFRNCKLKLGWLQRRNASDTQDQNISGGVGEYLEFPLKLRTNECILEKGGKNVECKAIILIFKNGSLSDALDCTLFSKSSVLV